MFKYLVAIANLVFVLIALASVASAIDFTASGTILTVTYTEPTSNSDKTPLTDLAKTTIYYSINGAAEVKVTPDIAATVPTGGGSVSTQVTVPIAAGQSASVTVRATATDTSGNESVKSVSVSKTIDRLSPMPPS